MCSKWKCGCCLDVRYNRKRNWSRWIFQYEFDDFVKAAVLSELLKTFDTRCIYEENIIYVPVGVERYYVRSTKYISFQDIHIFAYMVAIFVSIAVPTTWRKWRPLNWQFLFVSYMIWRISFILCFWKPLVCKTFLQGCIPSSCGMSEYRDVNSLITMWKSFW